MPSALQKNKTLLPSPIQERAVYCITKVPRSARNFMFCRLNHRCSYFLNKKSAAGTINLFSCFAIRPTNIAAASVPSRTPCNSLRKMNERAVAMITKVQSHITFIYPNLTFGKSVQSASASPSPARVTNLWRLQSLRRWRPKVCPQCR